MADTNPPTPPGRSCETKYLVYTPPPDAQIYRFSKNGFYLTQQIHTKLSIRTLIHNIMPDVLVGV